MLNVLFPKFCSGCGGKLLKNEEVLCISCRHKLPLACFHRTNDPSMKQVFYGRIPVENATALIHFEKEGLSQHILHQLKYRGAEDVSGFFGKWLGGELANHEAYQEVQMVIPIPLHKRKQRKRGYNQVHGFGREIAHSLGVPFRTDILLKKSAESSQVFRKRWGRFTSDGAFTVVDSRDLLQQHILLVDDIVTTGATLEKCGQLLLKDTQAKLSVATIAIA